MSNSIVPKDFFAATESHVRLKNDNKIIQYEIALNLDQIEFNSGSNWSIYSHLSLQSLVIQRLECAPHVEALFSVESKHL